MDKTFVPVVHLNTDKIGPNYFRSLWSAPVAQGYCATARIEYVCTSHPHQFYGDPTRPNTTQEVKSNTRDGVMLDAIRLANSMEAVLQIYDCVGIHPEDRVVAFCNKYGVTVPKLKIT